MKLFTMFFIYVLWALSARASTGPVLIKEIPVFDIKRVEVDFQINRNLGRSWVTVSYANSTDNRRDHPRTEQRILVEGLSFDTASSMITLDTHQCATVRSRGRSIFRYDEITPTGCELRHKLVKKMIDDGYYTYYRNYLEIYLVVK